MDPDIQLNHWLGKISQITHIALKLNNHLAEVYVHIIFSRSGASLQHTQQLGLYTRHFFYGARRCVFTTLQAAVGGITVAWQGYHTGGDEQNRILRR